MLATHTGDQDGVPVSWLGPGPNLAIVGAWQIEPADGKIDLCISTSTSISLLVSLCLSRFQYF